MSQHFFTTPTVREMPDPRVLRACRSAGGDHEPATTRARVEALVSKTFAPRP